MTDSTADMQHDILYFVSCLELKPLSTIFLNINNLTVYIQINKALKYYLNVYIIFVCSSAPASSQVGPMIND